MLAPSGGRRIAGVWDFRAIYLLEAYNGPDGGRATPDALRNDLAARGGVEIIGLVVVPLDEAVLCLVAADSLSSEAAIRAVADRYGPGARLLRVDWAASPRQAHSPQLSEASP